jgi:phosphoglycerate dehydrogenase-like enzyme
MKPVLLILDDWEGRVAASPSWQMLDGLVEIRFLNKALADADEKELLPVEYLMAIRERTALTAQVFERLPGLKLILQTGGHAYHIDRIAAEKRGIPIALGRRAIAPLDSVPELVFAMALGLMHMVPQGNKAVHNGYWPQLTGRTLSKKRLGILGMGRHGTRVANIAANAFKMDVVAWNRKGDKDPTGNGAFPRLSLDELLMTSDLISIHLRLSAESAGLFNKDCFLKMKPGAILINTSRGAIVDEQALEDALAKGSIGGAGLDVFVQEPLPADSPLRLHDNVILTPHIGWTVGEVFEEFAQIASKQLLDYLQGVLDDSELLRPS